MNEHEVFRYVPRDRRAVYVRLMHGTMAVKWRNLGRAVRRLVPRPLR